MGGRTTVEFLSSLVNDGRALREVLRCVHYNGNQVQRSRATLELNSCPEERRACKDGVELRASRSSAGGQEAKGGSRLEMLMGDGATFA